MGSRIRIMLGKLIWLIFVVVEVRGQEVCNTPECRLAAESILSSLDVTAEPCSDFYQFACGGWMAKNSIPEGKSKWGRFYELRDKVDQALHEIVDGEWGERGGGRQKPAENVRWLHGHCSHRSRGSGGSYRQISRSGRRLANGAGQLER